MRSLTVRSPWSLVRCNPILGAILLAWLVTVQSCPAQEAPAAGPDKKPATAPAQGNGPGGNISNMMGQMRGKMGGSMGKMMGQPGKPSQSAEPTLEEMLSKALKDNPDIRVAEAKVREAEAELNRTRLQVTQKVLAFHHTRESQKAIVKIAEEDLQRIQKLEASKAVSQGEVKQVQQRLSAAKAKLAEVEAEMPYLLGQQHKLEVILTPYATFGTPSAEINPQIFGLQSANNPQINPQIFGVEGADLYLGQSFSAYFGPLGTRIGAPQEAKSLADKVRKALDTKVTVDYRNKLVSEILDDLKKKAPGLSIHDLSGISNHVINLQIDGQVPLRTALELLEDTCSVLREQQGV